MIELYLPLEQIKVTQPFGTNYLDFYKKLGMIGHNGLDLKANDSCPIYACHYGTVSRAEIDPNAGKFIEIWDIGRKYKTQYFHLKEFRVLKGDVTGAGKIIGYADNTGLSTGAHLHLTLKETSYNGEVRNRDNGYFGAVDPSPYFSALFDRTRIKNKDFSQPRAYHRYSMLRQSLPREWQTVWELAKILKRLPRNEEINARLYGKWEIESLKNPAMYELWSQLTKEEYENGKKLYS